ncbi:MAG: hypothetical protein OXM56_00340 [Gammaproteobacteria bacterium]|nr:hypothetical protein [Gammaproteobacteria bacterium]
MRRAAEMPVQGLSVVALVAAMLCSGCVFTYAEVDAQTETAVSSGAETVTAAAEYLGSLGEGACGEEGWSASVVAASDGTVQTVVECGTGAEARALRLRLRSEDPDGATAADWEDGLKDAEDHLRRALEAGEACADGEARSLHERTVDDEGRTVEIRIECDRPAAG